MSNLTLGSLFSGSGGFELGAMLNGITPIWASEVAPFPIRVTTKRIPKIKHYSDICKIDGSKIEPVSIISFGSPCQSFSLAGKREGIKSKCTICNWETEEHSIRICPVCGADASVSASSLFYEAIRVIDEMLVATKRAYPQILIMENVPGMLSSGSCNDFKKILQEFKRLGFAIDINILDAQHMGVPQRRRRVFIVAIQEELAPEHMIQNKLPREKAVEKAMNGYDGCQFYGIVTTPYQKVHSTLSEILETNVDTKYYLSAKACQGILRRANNRGKELPPMLQTALERQANDEYTIGQTKVSVSFEPGAMSRLGGHHSVEQVCTLRAQMGDNQACVAIQNHPNDSRVKIENDGKTQALTSRIGTGGGNAPMVLNIRQMAMTVGENIANTLTQTDYKSTQCVCETKAYGICSDKSNSMLSSNSKSGKFETS